MMTLPEVRNQVVIDIEFAVNTGARQLVACAMMGIATTTTRRWKPSNDEAVQMINDLMRLDPRRLIA
ncbi:MAG: hypothetical protein ACI8PV_001047 [Dinoroseobacter sp.]|jgi:hypothetical protein